MEPFVVIGLAALLLIGIVDQFRAEEAVEVLQKAQKAASSEPAAPPE